MKEFTGQLIGGPDDGNFVTASLAEIPVVSTTELALDGDKEGADTSIIVIRGRYIWQEDKQYFIWQQVSCQVYSKKAEMV